MAAKAAMYTPFLGLLNSLISTWQFHGLLKTLKNLTIRNSRFICCSDATARLSRVPYTKHQLTGLIVVPYLIEDDYDEIIMNSLNPYVENFNKEDYKTDFHKHLQKIDQFESYNAKVKSINRIPNKVRLVALRILRYP